MNNCANQHWEELCCEFSKLLKTESSLAGSTGMTSSFFSLNPGFGPVSVPCWDQMDQLYSLNCSGDQKSGMSPRQVCQSTAYLHRWQIRPGFIMAWCQPASSLRGEDLVVAALSLLYLGLSQCQPAWWLWVQASVLYKYT